MLVRESASVCTEMVFTRRACLHVLVVLGILRLLAVCIEQQTSLSRVRWVPPFQLGFGSRPGRQQLKTHTTVLEEKTYHAGRTYPIYCTGQAGGGLVRQRCFPVGSLYPKYLGSVRTLYL